MQFLGSWWPASGGRYYNSAAFYNVGIEGLYWSASPTSTTYEAYRLLFYSGIVYPVSNIYRSAGLSVRCVQEEGKKFLAQRNQKRRK